MCSSCGKSKCGGCSSKTISKTGKKGLTGPKGPRGPEGPAGPAFVPLTYFKERTSFQFMASSDADPDADLSIAVPAGTYLVWVEVDAIFNRDTIVSELGTFQVFLNGALNQRIINLDNPGVYKKNVKLILNARVVMGAAGNIYVNYVMSNFALNPSTTMTFQTGSLTILKVA